MPDSGLPEKVYHGTDAASAESIVRGGLKVSVGGALMSFLNLNLYQHSSGVAFDPNKVIGKARRAFPEATFLPGDQAAAEVHRAEEALAEKLRQDPKGSASVVLASLRRKAQSYGPSYAFTIPVPNGEPIRGLARSVGVGFLFEKSLPEEMRQRLLAFLEALGVGFLEAPKEDGRTREILADLHGPSDCLREEPGVPWLKPSEPIAMEVG